MTAALLPPSTHGSWSSAVPLTFPCFDTFPYELLISNGVVLKLSVSTSQPLSWRLEERIRNGRFPLGCEGWAVGIASGWGWRRLGGFALRWMRN